eukprot:TRINITY_DN63959_c0_g1_i1.p1 TRINITY_DN63959_c0_g1~~TRINITY_DN63959_c0_g1_i1.p1  ORF type:complete len:276 (-),score=75.96 TRINITY_DN63959_c0_g1_i1:299-1126(-)
MFFCCAEKSLETEAMVTVDQEKSITVREQVDVAALLPKKKVKARQASESGEETKVGEGAARKATEEVVVKKKTEEDAVPQKAADGSMEYVVVLTMDSQKTPLGLQLLSPTNTVLAFRDGCLAAKHNDSGAGEKIQLGDMLLSFNGCQAEACLASINDAYKALPVGAKMKLTFMRETGSKTQELVVEMFMDSRKTPLGIALEQSSSSNWFVQSITDGGLVAKHNASSGKEKVKLGDEIRAFNFCETSQCLAAIQEAYATLPEGAKMTFHLIRPDGK